MKLTDLNPKWINREERSGLGFVFQCPVHHEEDFKCEFEVLFLKPLDGGEPVLGVGELWPRTGGVTFETLSLGLGKFSPSIHITNPDGSTHWQGFIRDGEVMDVSE